MTDEKQSSIQEHSEGRLSLLYQPVFEPLSLEADLARFVRPCRPQYTNSLLFGAACHTQQSGMCN